MIGTSCSAIIVNISLNRCSGIPNGSWRWKKISPRSKSLSILRRKFPAVNCFAFFFRSLFIRQQFNISWETKNDLRKKSFKIFFSTHAAHSHLHTFLLDFSTTGVLRPQNLRHTRERKRRRKKKKQNAKIV